MALDRTSIRTDMGYLSRRRKAAAPPATERRNGSDPRRKVQPRPYTPAPAGLAFRRSSRPVPARRPHRLRRPQWLQSSGPGPRRPSRSGCSRPRILGRPRAGGSQPGSAPERQAVRDWLAPGDRGSLGGLGGPATAPGCPPHGRAKAGTAVSHPRKPALAGVQDGAGIVSLRHIRLLRRALFVAGETPLTVGVFDGAAAAVAARNDAGLRSVLYVVRVGAVLELRAEFVPADASDAAIWAMFGFTMTIPLDQRVLLR